MIRRRFIANLRAQDWTAVCIDLVIVVVGILLALQISEWNQAREDRARERTYLTRIAAELEQSVRDIERSIQIAQRRETLGRLLIAAANDEAPVRDSPGEFLVALQSGAYTFSPAIRSHAFDELRSVGDLDLIEDKSLLAAITEFYTEVRETAQWHYLREHKQTEYVKRAAGILTLEQLLLVDTTDRKPVVTVADALAMRARMVERPDFVAWLPTVAHRYDEIDIYRQWLAQARAVHERIVLHLAKRADA